MDKKYERGVHLIGRIGLIIGVVFMLGIPAVISAVYHVWPTSITQVMTIGGGLLLMFIPTALAEVISYTPVLGSSAYITFLTGNVMNLKMPCVINSHTLTGTTQGTDEGDTIAAISVAASSITTTLIIIAGVLLMVPLRPILTSPMVATATSYLLPSLFGGMVLSFMNESCGEYTAKGKNLVMILPLVLVFVINLFYPLSGKEGFAVLACMALNVLIAWVLYKKNIIKMIPKSPAQGKSEMEELAEDMDAE